MLVKITDLCGREGEYVTEASELEAPVYEIIRTTEGDVINIGEFQYTVIA